MFCKMKRITFYIVILTTVLFLSANVFAEEAPAFEEQNFYLDKTELVEQQISLLKKRLQQANQDLTFLKQEQKKNLISTNDQANKYVLYKTSLHIASAKSNLESIGIELTDSQKSLTSLEKNIQDIRNHLSALNIFGHKLFHDDPAQIQSFNAELKYQQNLYNLERQRINYLTDLQKIEATALQLYRERYAQVNALLKSRQLLHIKERQVKSELEFQQQQNYWLQRLESLYAEMKSHNNDKVRTVSLEREIFYANENINLVYSRTLVTRYQDQVRQMRLAVSRANSIGLLNSLSDQVQLLSKQIDRLNDLISGRIEIINKRQAVYQSENQLNTVVSTQQSKTAQDQFVELKELYQQLRVDTGQLSNHLLDFRGVLDKAIQQELSARQGLPGFSSGAWLDLGKEVLLVPVLSFKLIKGTAVCFIKALQKMTVSRWMIFLLAQAAFLLSYFSLKKKIAHLFQKYNTENIINTQKVIFSLLLRHISVIAVIVNLWMVFNLLRVSAQEYGWLLNLSMTILFFRILFSTTRAILLETPHESGHDVKLYYRLKRLLWAGSITTFITVFLHQLPLIYEISDLFDRLFLVLLLCVAIMILKSWRIVPELIMQYVDPKRTYLRRSIYFLGFFIPGLLFINSLIGLFGFINLVGIISWYEGIFTLVAVAYFLVRGLLSEAMEALSYFVIRYVNNGWLLTEAFLKPLHTILRLSLFFGAWVVLFLFYGWNQQSPVVEQLTRLLSYPLFNVLNTTITPINI
ncbi:MAG TPA: hypothetical protein VHA13_02705, partial [Gammaproteobacteria bacterium]|nr:hypothetical protein [Gammaproteobacteria bacterium]